MEVYPGAVIAGRFRVERRLGSGGMGSVWLACHLSLDRLCALKVLHSDAAASPALRARFEREAKAAAQLRSPYIVQILEYGVYQDLPFIAMELLEGEDLDERLRRTRTLEPRAAARIVDQVARALGKAHAAGLVHRDLKPANVFLVRDEDREIAKVVDFGVAKQTGLELGDSRTKTGAILGTPYYMSPEQVRGLHEVDHRADLWSLAVIAYLCLVGRLPFLSDTLYDLFTKIVSEPLPVPSQVAAVPPAFDAWWAHAAARDPNQRFQSARELADALAVSLGLSKDFEAEHVLLPPLPAPPLSPATPMPAVSQQTPSVSALRAPSHSRAALAGAAVLAAAALGVAVLALRLRARSDHATAPALTASVQAEALPDAAPAQSVEVEPIAGASAAAPPVASASAAAPPQAPHVPRATKASPRPTSAPASGAPTAAKPNRNWGI